MSGHVHDTMRKTRAEYEYGIRQVKSKQGMIIKQQFARALNENNTNNFGQLNILRNKKTSSAHCIITGDKNI